MTDERAMLNDRCDSRDRPVLLEIAREVDAGETHPDSRALASKLGLDGEDVARIFVALEWDGYIACNNRPITAEGTGSLIHFANDLTGRGRREVGLWPNGDNAAAALLDALRQAEDLAADPDDKSALRKAAGQLVSVSRAVIADLTTAYIRSQTGI